jgi:hypothetical protein
LTNQRFALTTFAEVVYLAKNFALMRDDKKDFKYKINEMHSFLKSQISNLKWYNLPGN